MMKDFDKLYSGIDASGALILQPAFAESLRQQYIREGWAVPPSLARGKSRAFDSAEGLDERPARRDETQYALMNAAYKRLLKNGGQPTFEPTITGDFEGAAERTRGNAEAFRQGFSPTTQADEDAALKRFKKARGWDSLDAATERQFRMNFQIEAAYRRMLHEPQSLGVLTFNGQPLLGVR
jgi:hypothetical protein